MALSAFKPVLVCCACGCVMASWDILPTRKNEERPREIMWLSEDGCWKWPDERASSPNLERIASAWACCSGCGVMPLVLRKLTARHSLVDVWNPFSWFLEKKWFLAGVSGKGGELSIATPDEENIG